MIIHLGVVDVPYSAESFEKPPKKSKFRRGSAKRPARDVISKAGDITTGDVATILEKKYHIEEAFWKSRHGEKIANAITEDLNDYLNDKMAGAPVELTFAAALSTAHTEFQEFIDSREMNGMPNIPTDAAKRGVNHRFLHPYATNNPERPSFRDTGLMEASFVAWLEK